MRRWLLIVAVIVILVLVLAPLAGYLWLRTSLPVTQGAVRLAGLNGKVEIVRDQAGVPHINATTDHDAFFGLGYAHAQDRLWQMEMNRRIGAGRLSEVLGDATLDIDKFQRTMGYYNLVESDYAALSARSRDALDAYAAGVNAWLSENHPLPPEFLLLGVHPEPWKPLDSLVWEKMMSWDLGGDYDMELVRQQLVAAIGPERTSQLLPPYPADGPTIVPAVSAVSADRLLHVDSALQANFGKGGREIGSNNWVVTGSRTATGKPMLANDPHLSTSIPSVWYLAEMKGDKIHAMGATFPGLPAIVIGHNDRIAWGVTNLDGDTQDLYIERINPDNPNQYEVNGTWQDMTIRPESIRIKGQAEPLEWAARSTRHGPLIGDVSDAGAPMALRWAALDPGDTTMDAFLGFNYAGNWDEFTRAMQAYFSPSQNIIYADVDGNIGYHVPGHLPIRPAGHTGMLPNPGWNDEAEWTGYIPFDQLPQLFNPEQGYVVTANNKIVDASYPYTIGNDFAPPYRAARITQLVEQLSTDADKLTMDDMAAIQGDRTSLQVPELLPFLKAVPPQNDRQRQAIDLLQSWDGTLALDSAAAAIYEAWMMQLERGIFADDLRTRLFEEMSTRANPTFLTNVLNDPTLSAAWCDNVLSTPKEDCTATAQAALGIALTDLTERLGSSMPQWRWDRIHMTQYPHRPFSEVSYLKPVFHRSIGTGGDRFTVNVAPVNLATPYDNTHAPGYRQLLDLSDWQNSRFIQTTGQSGNVLSPHYDDLIQSHRDRQYLPMSFGQTQLTGEVLTLEPLTP